MALNNSQVAAEKAIKQFYERFRDEHISFYGFVKGIDDHIDQRNKKQKKTQANQENKNKQWYVSLMLNRLMFCYFIQSKGFLDNNKNYLREKLEQYAQKKGKVKSNSFYRNFLLVLFYEGLNKPTQNEKIHRVIGRVPYLNGEVFDKHELEKSFHIEIDGKAFEQLFNFFDQYEWHLDNSVQSGRKNITPDVIGYIFEQYINDRAQMGAYYTKEDITEYISKNCIIPWLFDETARKYPEAFARNGAIWELLRKSGEAYIYPAVKNGTNEGSKRFREIAQKIRDGSITHINDFISFNLNIREFVRDIINNTEDPEFLEAFYKSLFKVTIIDPTCGSGAFLIAAMNILEPLHHECINRMRRFIEDDERQGKDPKKKTNDRHPYFRSILEAIDGDHNSNTAWFNSKNIILNNLFGVDLMKEAAEIAKLRLFLRLVSTMDTDSRTPGSSGLYPLPDIDFNIQTGNILSEFAGLPKVANVRKGFDIIIGNPPYLAAGKLSYDPAVKGFKCSDLYGYVVARCFDLLHQNSRFGFIVMHNLAFSRSFADVRKVIRENAANSWFSFFARIPSGLFSGDIRVRICIFLLEMNKQASNKQSYTTRIHRWFTEDREHLFQKLTYTGFKFGDVVPMFNDEVLENLFKNLRGKKLLEYEVTKSKHLLYFKKSAYNWISVSPQPAPCYKKDRKIAQSQVSEIAFVSEEAKKLSLLLLNGKLFFSYWLTYGDEFHVTREDLLSIRVPYEQLTAADKKTLLKLAAQFEKELETTVQYKLNAGKKVGTYNTSKLWHITDKSDIIFLRYWTEKEGLIPPSIENHISQTILTVA